MDLFLKNGRFSGRIWPDWGNAARADMAGLGSIDTQTHTYTNAHIYKYTHRNKTHTHILFISLIVSYSISSEQLKCYVKK